MPAVLALQERFNSTSHAESPPLFYIHFFILRAEPCIVSAITDGNGTVTSPQEDVNAGKTATVTAMANIGYKFAYWTDEQGNKVSTNAIYTFKVTRGYHVTGKFLARKLVCRYQRKY